MSRGLLSVDEAVEVLTARKTKPAAHRVAAVLDRLAEQGDRQVVADRVAAHWAPLPARARVRTQRLVPEVWGPGVQLELLPVGVEVGF